jgi:hypothetical protein
MKIKKAFLFFAVLSAILFAASGALAVTLTVGQVAGKETATVQVPITVDVPNTIAGAAFTVTYDTTKLTLTNVQSTFFDTFQNQWNQVNPVPNPLPPTSVIVDSVTYSQPLLSNKISTGTMIAAARCTPAGGANSTLFTLSFELNDGAPLGEYPVAVISSVINNTNAGYDAGGEAIPMLIGADPTKDVTDPLAFPVLLDPPGTGSVVAGKVTFVAMLDTDSDGIDDDWEQTNFGNLTTANGTSDFEHDGYSDKQEYINGTDPKVMDAQGGTGYNAATDWRTTAQQVTFNAGWNWVSFNKFPDDRSLQNFFGNNLQYVEAIKHQTSSCLKVAGNWTGNLNILNDIANCTMFKIKVTQGFQLTVMGNVVPLTTTRNLPTGWSWIAYLPTSSVAWNTAVASIYSNLTAIKSQTNANLYVGGNWTGNLVNMEPGKGYAVKLSAPATLDYPGD